jgi:hypothetical protein
MESLILMMIHHDKDMVVPDLTEINNQELISRSCFILSDYVADNTDCGIQEHLESIAAIFGQLTEMLLPKLNDLEMSEVDCLIKVLYIHSGDSIDIKFSHASCMWTAAN